MRGIFESNTRKQQHHYQSAKPKAKGGEVFYPYDSSFGTAWGGIKKDGIIYDFPPMMGLYFPGLGEWTGEVNSSGNPYVFNESAFTVEHAGYNSKTNIYGLLLKAPNAKTATAIPEVFLSRVKDPASITRIFRGAASPEDITFTDRGSMEECKTPLALPIYDVYIYREIKNPEVEEVSAFPVTAYIRNLFSEKMAAYEYEADDTLTNPSYTSQGGSYSVYQWAEDRLNDRMGLPPDIGGFYLPEGAEFVEARFGATGSTTQTPYLYYTGTSSNAYIYDLGTVTDGIQDAYDDETLTITGAMTKAEPTGGDGTDAFERLVRSYEWPKITSSRAYLPFERTYEEIYDEVISRYDAYALYGYILVLKGFDLVKECSLNQSGREVWQEV